MDKSQKPKWSDLVSKKICSNLNVTVNLAFKVKRLEPAEINFGNLEGVLGNPINYNGDSIQTHLNRIF